MSWGPGPFRTDPGLRPIPWVGWCPGRPTERWNDPTLAMDVMTWRRSEPTPVAPRALDDPLDGGRSGGPVARVRPISIRKSRPDWRYRKVAHPWPFSELTSIPLGGIRHEPAVGKGYGPHPARAASDRRIYWAPIRAHANTSGVGRLRLTGFGHDHGAAGSPRGGRPGRDPAGVQWRKLYRCSRGRRRRKDHELGRLRSDRK